MTRTQARYYLAALIDGEGHVRSNGTREMTIGNTDENLIQAAIECLETLGITYGKIIRATASKSSRNHDMMYVAVYGRDNFKLLARLPLRSEKKRLLIAEGARRRCWSRDRNDSGHFVAGHTYYPRKAIVR